MKCKRTPPRRFKWVVVFEINSEWVADGFEMTDERAANMLLNDLCHCRSTEVRAKVVVAPDKRDIKRVQNEGVPW